MPVPAQPKRRRGFLWWIGLIVVVVVGLVVVVAATQGSTSHTIEGRVTSSTGQADVLWSVSQGGSDTQTVTETVKAPWSASVTVKGGYAVSLIVNLPNLGTGAVTCEILVDGKVVASHSAKGAGAIATCSA